MKEQGQRLQHSCRLEYKAYTFNHVSVLSIHDLSLLKASCAFSINIGSVHEPNQIPGVAHLMQHMLFINSQQYPQPHDFSKFMSESAGYENAQTCDFFTNYYFQVTCSKLQQALIRACDAFAHPLFDQSSIAAEIHAINEQYNLCSNDDDSRVQQLNKLFMVSPLNRFSMGSHKSLNVDNIRKHLCQFYQKYYRHPNATINIVICSSLTNQQIDVNFLKHIQKMSIDMFGGESAQQTNDTLLKNMVQVQTFPQHNLQKCLIFKSVSNQDCMKIEIIIDLLKNPLVNEHLRSKNYPNNKSSFQQLPQFIYEFTCLISSILCHPSKHSLSSYLQPLQLTTDATVQSIQIIPYTQFMIIISIQLEDHALDRKHMSENISRIYTKFIQYLELYLIWDNVENIANQMYTIEQLKYHNYQVDDMEEYVCHIARNIQEFGLFSALSYKAMTNNVLLHRRDLTSWCIQQLLSTKNQLILISSGDDIKGNIKYEPYLNTNYMQIHYPSIKSSNTLMQSQNSMLNMLRPNPYLHMLKQCKNNPITNPITQPIVIKVKNNNHTHTHTYARTHIHFSHSGSPIIKGGVKLLMHTNQSYVFCRLFTQFMDLFVQELVENYMYAQFIGLDCYFDYQNGQLFAYFYGFTPLLHAIVQALGQQLGKFVQNVKNGKAKSNQKLQDIFDQAMENLEQDIDNYYQQQMDDLTDKIRDQVLIQSSLPLLLIAKQADKIKKNKFLQRCADLLTQCVMEWIVVGNFNLTEIQIMVKQFQQSLGNNSASLQAQKVKQTKVMNLSNLVKPLKLQIRLQSEQIQTSTCLTYFQAGLYNERLFWLMEIAEMYLEQPFYQHCRINKKLTYDLQVNVVNTRGILGICFLMVSSKIDSEAIANQIRQFLRIYINPDKLQQYLVSNLERLKQSLILKHSQPFPTVEDTFDSISDQVTNRSFYFTSRNKSQVQSKLNSLSLQQITAQLIQIFSHSCLEILLVSKCHKDAYAKHKPKTISLDQIKSNADYYKDNLAQLKFSFRAHH